MTLPNLAPVALVLWTAGIAWTQTEHLDRQIAADFPIEASSADLDNLVQSRVAIIGRVTGLLTGFENTLEPAPHAAQARTVDMRGLTVRQALDLLVSLDGRYEWRDMSGVVVMRPKTSWNDCAHFLNRGVSFSRRDLNARSAIGAMLHLIDPASPEHALPGSAATSSFEVDVPHGRVLDVFNSIATMSHSSWRIVHGASKSDAQWIELSLERQGGPRVGWGAMLRPAPAACGR